MRAQLRSIGIVLGWTICALVSIVVMSSDFLSFIFLPESFRSLFNYCNDYSTGYVVKITAPRNMSCDVLSSVDGFLFVIKGGLLCYYLNTNDTVVIAYNHYKKNESSCSYFVTSPKEYPSGYISVLVVIYIMLACWVMTTVLAILGFIRYRMKEEYESVALSDKA